MGITDHLSAGDVLLGLDATSKRDVLQRLAAEAAARLGRPEAEILKALQDRESLGSTALGRGIGLPHALLGGDLRPFFLLARLRRPVDFEARDEEPVDIVLLVLWPEASAEGFLPALAEACRPLRDPGIVRRLRSAETPEEVMGLIGRPGAGEGGAAATDTRVTPPGI